MISENATKFIELLRADSALKEEFFSQTTKDDAYAFAVNVVPGLTMDEFIAVLEECTKVASHKMSDEEMEEVGGGYAPKRAMQSEINWSKGWL